MPKTILWRPENFTKFLPDEANTKEGIAKLKTAPYPAFMAGVNTGANAMLLGILDYLTEASSIEALHEKLLVITKECFPTK